MIDKELRLRALEIAERACGGDRLSIVPYASELLAFLSGETEVGKPAAERKKYRTGLWSRERLLILHRDWPTGRATRKIIADINNLPGPPLEAKDLSLKACAGRLLRPSSMQPANLVAARAALVARKSA